jgi:acyl-CoA hydrolase
MPKGPLADPADIVDHLPEDADLIVPLANGEPVALLDAVEARSTELGQAKVHQMHALSDRPSIRGELPNLRHVSYFLSHVTRGPFAEGKIDLVPNHFSEVPAILRGCTKHPVVLAAASPMDAHGYFSLGVSCDYVAPFIGKVPFWLEVNERMPRTFGRNQLHVSQVEGWVEVDRPLVAAPQATPGAKDRAIAAFIAERVDDGDTIQCGIGATPNAVLEALRGHQHLGVHTELLSDGLVDLVQAGVVTGTRKTLNPNKVVTTFAFGTQRVYDFLHENSAIEFWPVDYVNDPRIIAREENFVSINATLAVDFLGQCASETMPDRYYSSSGGQADFARGAMWARDGEGYIVLHSTTSDGSISRIMPRLPAGAAVTTMKNTVDKVVTEHGVAELRGRSIAARTKALIAIAEPAHRDALEADARLLGYL